MAQGRITPARAALAGAGLVAAAAIGVALTRGGDRAPFPDAAAPPAAADPAGDMVAALERKVRQQAGDATGWMLLGRAYFEAGRHADAVTAYTRATAIDPARAEPWSALGEATVMAERDGVSARAEAAFRRALAIDPGNARARYFLAVKKDLAGDHRAAVADWIALLRDGPADAPWAPDVRQLVEKVAADNGIDIAGRLPPPPAGAAPPPEPLAERMRAMAAMPQAERERVIRTMVDTLAARLRADPADPDGWIRLMRARTVLGDAAGARAALAEGRAANPAARARLDEAARTLGIPPA